MIILISLILILILVLVLILLLLLISFLNYDYCYDCLFVGGGGWGVGRVGLYGGVGQKASGLPRFAEDKMAALGWNTLRSKMHLGLCRALGFGLEGSRQLSLYVWGRFRV